MQQIQAPPNSNIFRRLVHDVPVTIIPVREWAEYQFPALQNYDVGFMLHFMVFFLLSLRS